MKQLTENLHIIVKVLFVSEACLCDQIFRGLELPKDHCYYEVITTSLLKLLSYGNLADISKWPIQDICELREFQNEVSEDIFQTVLTRFNTITKMAYRDDPTIMAWELINEPHCHVDYSGRIVNTWVQEMATYTKILDSKHLLENGMEGFYGDSMPVKKHYNPVY